MWELDLYLREHGVGVWMNLYGLYKWVDGCFSDFTPESSIFLQLQCPLALFNMTCIMALLPSCHFPIWFSQTVHWALQGQRALTGPAYMIVGVWIYNDTGSGHESMMGGVRRGYTFPKLFFTSSRIRDCQTINHKITVALSLQLQHFLSDCLVFIYSCRQELTVL